MVILKMHRTILFVEREQHNQKRSIEEIRPLKMGPDFFN